MIELESYCKEMARLTREAAIPEHRLLYAELEDALRLLMRHGKVEQRDRKQAIIWFASDGYEVGSFFWVCDHINLDPTYVRRIIAHYLVVHPWMNPGPKSVVPLVAVLLE